MPASRSKSSSNHKNRRKSVSPDKKKASRQNRSASSGSSHSSRSSRSRRSGARRSRSHDKGREANRYPPRRDFEKVPPSNKLFVTNIDSKYSQEELERDLKSVFEPFGKVKDIIIKTKQGSSNSYVFIEYDDIESAVKAQEELKSRDFKGKQLKVEFGRGERKNEDRKSDKCYICHKEGHFAKDCRYNRYTSSADMSRPRKDTRDDRDRGRDRDGDRRHRRHDSRSRSRSSSGSRSYRKRHSERDRDRDDYRRRDTRRSPQKRGEYYSRRH